jgi:hypothetical protein
VAGAAAGPRTFPDFGPLAGELRAASLILANACKGSACVGQDYGDGRFGPSDQVTHAQVFSFVARAFQLDPTYAWQPQPGGEQPYVGVPVVHDADIRTYRHYAGTFPDALTTATGWNQPTPRAWVAVLLWQALQAPP